MSGETEDVEISRISRACSWTNVRFEREGALAWETSTNTNWFYWWSNEEGNPISRWGTSKLIEANRMMILWWPRLRPFHPLDAACSWKGEEEGEDFFISFLLLFFFFFFFLGTFHRTRIRIICLIAPDYRRLNEDPGTMEELTETMECKVAFKWEQL